MNVDTGIPPTDSQSTEKGDPSMTVSGDISSLKLCGGTAESNKNK